MNAIEVTDLSKSYTGFELENITFSHPTGSIMGLIGENGAGKSTTIKLLMNAISRDSGIVKVMGVDNQNSEFKDIKEDIGVVLDEAYFPELLTPKIVNRVMKHTYRNWDESCFFSYLTQFKLPEKKEFKDFSRGMKMKLAIAVAMSHNPRLLILDEATSGLDPIVRDELLDLFNDFTREESHSILLSSHIVSDLEKICDYIAFIHNGKLLFCKEKDKLLEDYAIVKMAHSDFEVVPNEAVIGKKVGSYHIEALVLKSSISKAIKTEHTSLEDIILFLAREGK